MADEADAPPRRRLTETEAASRLGYKAATLRKSRVTGILGNRAAPEYIRSGRFIFYYEDECDRWRAAGERAHKSTSEYRPEVQAAA